MSQSLPKATTQLTAQSCATSTITRTEGKDVKHTLNRNSTNPATILDPPAIPAQLLHKTAGVYRTRGQASQQVPDHSIKGGTPGGHRVTAQKHSHTVNSRPSPTTRVRYTTHHTRLSCNPHNPTAIHPFCYNPRAIAVHDRRGI